jgi:hypothetical protein
MIMELMRTCLACACVPATTPTSDPEDAMSSAGGNIKSFVRGKMLNMCLAHAATSRPDLLAISSIYHGNSQNFPIVAVTV